MGASTSACRPGTTLDSSWSRVMVVTLLKSDSSMAIRLSATWPGRPWPYSSTALFAERVRQAEPLDQPELPLRRHGHEDRDLRGAEEQLDQLHHHRVHRPLAGGGEHLPHEVGQDLEHLGLLLGAVLDGLELPAQPGQRAVGLAALLLADAGRARRSAVRTRPRPAGVPPRLRSRRWSGPEGPPRTTRPSVQQVARPPLTETP